MIKTYSSDTRKPLYAKLENHLKSKGYENPWQKYKILTDIDENEKTSILFLGLHAGIEPVSGLILLLHKRISNSKIFIIEYSEDVKLEDRLKSHETTEAPFIREKMADVVVSIHTMPDDWLERKIAVGGLPKQSELKKILAEKLREAISLEVIIANGENGFKEFIVQGQRKTNPVNYAAIREGVQIEFPYFLLKDGAHDQSIATGIIDSLLNYFHLCSHL
ncbi:MAG: poly-gamma-glutamate hydrolase family protein [Candidatus Anstonellales archaeon]